MQLPRLNDIDDTPVYNTRAVVRLTQVQAPRLRAWERRYHILAPHRSSNSYRLYSERDLAIIRWLRDQVEAGMTISQATSYLRIYAETGQAPTDLTTAPETVRLDALIPQLVDAALGMHEGGALSILRHAFAVHTVEEVCQELITPTMIAIGKLWEKDSSLVVAEHFISGVIRAQLTAIWQITYQPPEGPLVVVGCVPGEHHEIGALMLALFLRRQGVRVAYLGQSVEADSLARFVQATPPVTVCLSVTMPDHVPATLALAQTLLALPEALIVIGGQGITANAISDLSPRITFAGVDGRAAVSHIKRTLVTV